MRLIVQWFSYIFCLLFSCKSGHSYEVVHKIKKNIALRKHILKHGDFKDFTYYDRRYDPEEQCYSGYYRDLYSYKTGETKLCLKEGKY